MICCDSSSIPVPNNNAASYLPGRQAPIESHPVVALIGSMAEARLPRTGSFSGVWWKLGDDASVVERRLRGIADEETAVKVRIQRRRAGARGVRRKIASTSLSLEFLAFIYALWTARRRRMQGGHMMKLLLLLLLPLFAIPAIATVILTASARFQKIFDVKDQQELQRLAAERQASIGHFRGSHHSMQKLIEKYDPDSAAAADSPGEPVAPAAKLLRRTHSRLRFHVGDE